MHLRGGSLSDEVQLRGQSLRIDAFYLEAIPGGSPTMLILTRRTGEAVIIGDGISVTVLSINGIHVRIGVNAPRDVPVHREEVYKRIKQEAEKTES